MKDHFTAFKIDNVVFFFSIWVLTIIKATSFWFKFQNTHFNFCQHQASGVWPSPIWTSSAFLILTRRKVGFGEKTMSGHFGSGPQDAILLVSSVPSPYNPILTIKFSKYCYICDCSSCIWSRSVQKKMHTWLRKARAYRSQTNNLQERSSFYPLLETIEDENLYFINPKQWHQMWSKNVVHEVIFNPREPDN